MKIIYTKNQIYTNEQLMQNQIEKGDYIILAELDKESNFILLNHSLTMDELYCYDICMDWEVIKFITMTLVDELNNGIITLDKARKLHCTNAIRIID